MKYCFALILNLIWLTSLFGQEELRLISSRYSTIIDQQGFSSIQPVYLHKGNTLSADSGIIYEDEIGRQFFEAFGNVVITQPSGTVIYSDRLHYDATPQIATLTNNVRMVDDNSVLTTNHLIYRMRDQIGNYTGGGRIISQTDTITSRNAYYFENTKDAYFRNQVVVRTPDVKIYTDTMRYNSEQRMTYFFGPTNIKGNSGENLYTEKGNYNTETGVANFNENNLYTEGTRFLKGDSLYYDRATGIGKAYRNVVFVDTLDKFHAYGEYGLYDQADESITMTEKPLIIMVVENDSSSTAAPDSTAMTDSTAIADHHTTMTPVDSVEAEATVVEITEEEEKEEPVEIQTETSETQTTETEIEAEETEIEMDNQVIIETDSAHLEPPRDTVNVDSVYMTADTLYSRMIMLRDYDALDFNLDRSGGELTLDDDIDYGDDEYEDYGDDENDIASDGATLMSDSVQTTVDSVAMDSVSAEQIKGSIPIIDSIALHSVEQMKLGGIKEILPIDSTKKQAEVKEAARADIARSMSQDSILRQQAVIPVETTADSILNLAITAAQTPDTAVVDTNNEAYLDTARTRIVKAYYNVRMFKSDLQAVADSVYYGMADSMFRFMGRPMIWAEGSQISSDTIYMQIQNQRMDNALLINNAFMVNAVLDTVKFNQLKGRKITAFFANNAIDRLYVDGNAENLSFATNDKTHRITEMFHDRGARIKVKMEGKEIIDYITIQKVDQKLYPFREVTQENEVLPGFVWRPQDRPTSKEDMMNRKREVEKPQATEDSASDKSSIPETEDDFEDIEEIEEDPDETTTENEESPATEEETPLPMNEEETEQQEDSPPATEKEVSEPDQKKEEETPAKEETVPAQQPEHPQQTNEKEEQSENS